MDKKVKLSFASECDYDEYTLLKNVDPSKITLRVECPCGQEGCLLVQFFEESKDDSETSEKE